MFVNSAVCIPVYNDGRPKNSLHEKKVWSKGENAFFSVDVSSVNRCRETEGRCWSVTAALHNHHLHSDLKASSCFHPEVGKVNMFRIISHYSTWYAPPTHLLSLFFTLTLILGFKKQTVWLEIKSAPCNFSCALLAFDLHSPSCIDFVESFFFWVSKCVTNTLLGLLQTEESRWFVSHFSGQLQVQRKLSYLENSAFSKCLYPVEKSSREIRNPLHPQHINLE